MVTQHAIMTRIKNYVITVCLAAPQIVMNMNAIDLAGACAIELNVCAWEDTLNECPGIIGDIV